MDLPFLKLQSENIDVGEPDEYLVADRTMANAGFAEDVGFDAGFGEYQDEGVKGEFHATTDVEFGKGGDNWADASMVNNSNRPEGYDNLADLNGGHEQFIIALSGQEGENILSYFDERASKNWAGPEHWRIQRIKKGMSLYVRFTNQQPPHLRLRNLRRQGKRRRYLRSTSSRQRKLTRKPCLLKVEQALIFLKRNGRASHAIYFQMI